MITGKRLAGLPDESNSIVYSVFHASYKKQSGKKSDNVAVSYTK